MLTLKARHIPNIISTMRIILVYPVAHFLLTRQFQWALLVFSIAGISDGLDGFLARHFNWKSRLGSILDPVADKLLLLVSFLALGWMGLLPLWLVAAVLTRDLIILIGAAAYYHWLHPFDGQPNLISKFNTFLQLLLVVVTLISHSIRPLPEALMNTLGVLVFITTLISGAIYVYVWGSNFWRETHRIRQASRRLSQVHK